MFMMESVFFFIYKIAIIIFAAHSDMKKKYKIRSDKPRKNLQISPVFVCYRSSNNKNKG